MSGLPAKLLPRSRCLLFLIMLGIDLQVNHTRKFCARRPPIGRIDQKRPPKPVTDQSDADFCCQEAASTFPFLFVYEDGLPSTNAEKTNNTSVSKGLNTSVRLKWCES